MYFLSLFGCCFSLLLLLLFVAFSGFALVFVAFAVFAPLFAVFVIVFAPPMARQAI